MDRPLFYRLSDPQPGADVLNWDSVSQTVIEELERILSTKLLGGEKESHTILDFGIPNIVEFNTESSADKRQLLRHIKSSIEAFEPRLRDVNIQLLGDTSWSKVAIQISADLPIGERIERFSTLIQHK